MRQSDWRSGKSHQHPAHAQGGSDHQEFHRWKTCPEFRKGAVHTFNCDGVFHPCSTTLSLLGPGMKCHFISPEWLTKETSSTVTEKACFAWPIQKGWVSWLSLWVCQIPVIIGLFQKLWRFETSRPLLQWQQFPYERIFSRFPLVCLTLSPLSSHQICCIIAANAYNSTRPNPCIMYSIRSNVIRMKYHPNDFWSSVEQEHKRPDSNNTLNSCHISLLYTLAS